ncbi:MAG: lysostaphin resistance A-like protein [Gemmataceae bacterium]
MPARIRDKVVQLDVATPARFLMLAAFLSVLHSFLEEYYWRWFVFDRLRDLLPGWLAIVISSLAFMSHHVIVLDAYLPGSFWQATVPFSLCIAVGGAFWAWLFARSGSLLGPWLGHLLVDAAIMAVGYQMLFAAQR